jgi:hypothetical protein
VAEARDSGQAIQEFAFGAGSAFFLEEIGGDRRVSNPRHLEPQGSSEPENAGDFAPSLGQVGPENASGGQDSRTRGDVVARDTTAVGAAAVEFLTAVRAGEDRAVDLAERLANAVLDASGARLALEVLQGGPLTVTRAIRLAEQLLAGGERLTTGVTRKSAS